MKISYTRFPLWIRHLIVTSFSLLIGLQTPNTLADGSRLTITGSSTVAPLALEMAKRYERQHPGVRIDVQTGGSSRGINDARSGLADIGMVSRALKDNESDLTAHLIALDGISIILHRSNPIATLTGQEIVDIYTGKIRNWQEVGGPNLAITVVNKAEGRSTLELFLHHFELTNSQIKPNVIIGDNQQGIKTISANPGAIGYVSIGTAEFEVTFGTPIKLLPMGDVESSVANVAQGYYPLSRPLNFVTKTNPSELGQDFLRFAQSVHVKDLVEEQFFVAP
ncbi:phosphate ABC transporter substrate-binding protein [Aurantivibrio plasticivorans]